ncbi:Mitotic spindle assembly checkpoint protein MAD2B [Operophtera brumata]|uniref:Mitotic spindle assembly checkpoint protein MAD2B n=1 Tax=Operophtera brumata TaxID=104452 RepID=A0A0L7KXN8_OPEBR|nr:Mitotic spindle assembly checkpoint protein MAD2B [Operophtera brumata]
MDNCFSDLTQEFLSVAFHNILYYTRIYPPSIFETRRKYSIVVYRSIHPEVNQYIDLCLKTIAECLKSAQLSRIEFAITNNSYEPLVKFVFDFDKNSQYDETADAYLIQAEQNLRAFCLKLTTISNKLKNLPEDCSFSIYLHTNESTAVAMANNPDLEDFPLVEVESKHDELDKIFPLRSFSMRSYNIDTYAEFSFDT